MNRGIKKEGTTLRILTARCGNVRNLEENGEAEYIMQKEVEFHIRELKKNKTAGEDQVQNETWIHATNNITNKLTKI